MPAASPQPDPQPDPSPRTLSPDLQAAETTVRRLTFTDFAFEIRVGHHIGYLRSFAAPRVAALLGRTGQMDAEPHRRATDTALFVRELIHHGLDSPEGRKIVTRINAMHHQHHIHPDDYQWVLTNFVVPGLHIIDRYGWRPLTDTERQALIDWWTEAGIRFGAGTMPSTAAGWTDFVDRYDQAHLALSANGQRLLAATTAVAVEVVPRLLRPAVIRAGVALFDTRTRTALGLPAPGPISRAAVHLSLRGHALKRRLRGPGPAWFTPGAAHSDYPDGYTIDDLGPRDPRPTQAL